MIEDDEDIYDAVRRYRDDHREINPKIAKIMNSVLAILFTLDIWAMDNFISTRPFGIGELLGLFLIMRIYTQKLLKD